MTAGATKAYSRRTATIALFIATIGWGAGFTWAKIAGDAINRALGADPSAAIGQLWFLGVRYLLAAALWFLMFPGSRRGWSGIGLKRGLILGAFMSGGLVLQHVCLAHTAEAVTAFMTSLVVVFTPTLSTLIFRKPPPWIVWVGVAIAVVGVYLLAGASFSALGIGHLFGVLCALVFSCHAIAINEIVPRENSWRMTGIQFAVSGMGALGTSMFLDHGTALLVPSAALKMLAVREVWLNLVLLIVIPTLISFGLAMHFQPHVDVSQAVLIYLTEPIFAAGFAYLIAGRTLGGLAICGAGLILVANILVELVGSGRTKQIPVTEVM